MRGLGFRSVGWIEIGWELRFRDGRYPQAFRACRLCLDL